MTESETGHSVGKKIVRASIAVVIAHFLFKFAGLLQVMVLGYYLDPGIYESVYVVVFEGCIFNIFLIGEEVIGPAFLPVFMQEMDTKNEAAAWRFGSIVLTIQFVLLLGIVAGLMLAPGAMIELMTAWDADKNPEKFELARKSLFWLAPALVCLSLGSTTYMLLNGYKRFFFAAFGDAAWKYCVLVCVLVGMGVFGFDFRALIFGLVVGSVAKLVTHLVRLPEIRQFRPSLGFRNPAVKQMLLLILPLICGIVFAKYRDLYNNVTILSRLQEGLMQANSFGRKLHGAIGWLVPYALSIVMFPFFCEMVDKDDKENFASLLSGSGRMLLSILIPLSLVCVAVSEPLSAVMFHRGKVTAEVASWTAVAMSCYILVLPAQATECLLMQAFFAHRRMVAATVIGVAFSSLSIAISYIGVVVFGATGAAALAVIALGYALSRTLKAVTLAVFLKKNVPVFPTHETLVFMLRAVVVGVVSAGLCTVSLRLFERYVSSSSADIVLLAKLATGGAAAAFGFVISVWLCRLDEPGDMLKWAFRQLSARRSGKA
jgi:putative peptidoglycan lipid II flippase